MIASELGIRELNKHLRKLNLNGSSEEGKTMMSFLTMIGQCKFWSAYVYVMASPCCTFGDKCRAS